MKEVKVFFDFDELYDYVRSKFPDHLVEIVNGPEFPNERENLEDISLDRFRDMLIDREWIILDHLERDVAQVKAYISVTDDENVWLLWE